MKKSSLGNLFPWAILGGLFLGVFCAITGIPLLSYTVPILTLLGILILVTVIFVFAKESRYQLAMLNDGRYEEFIEYLTIKHERGSRFKSYKGQYLLSIANCLNRMGDFRESLNCLQKIDESRLDKNTKASYYSLYSSNLYFLNDNLRRAEELITKSRGMMDMPESILLQALIELELNKREESESLIEKYRKIKRKKYLFGMTVLIIDDYTRKISENFLLGLYHKIAGEEEHSKIYFSKSADCRYKNYFSDLSKELSM